MATTRTYSRSTICFRFLGWCAILVKRLPPIARPKNIPRDRKIVSPPALFSDIVPPDVSLKYVPRMRSDDLIMDPPAWATATTQNVPDLRTDRSEGTMFATNTPQAMQQYRWIRLTHLEDPPGALRSGTQNGAVANARPCLDLAAAIVDGRTGFCGSWTLPGESDTRRWKTAQFARERRAPALATALHPQPLWRREADSGMAIREPKRDPREAT